MSCDSTEQNHDIGMPNEIDIKWIDCIIKSLDEAAVLKTDSYDRYFRFIVNIVQQRSDDPYLKAHFLLYLSLARLNSYMGFVEELYCECIEIVHEIINFDHRHIAIGGLVIVANRAKRYDLREKVYRRFQQK